MTAKEKIKHFDDQNAPFYICDHEDGNYSLCLPLGSFMGTPDDYCQKAFDNYAEEIGEAKIESNGLHTYGNGYDWQAAFCQAFEGDANLDRFLFDCESGGFYMQCGDLDLLIDYAKRFKDICEDEEKFTPIVSTGIKQKERIVEEQEKIRKTVRGKLMTNPSATFDIQTPYGMVQLTPDKAQKLLAGEMHQIKIDGVIYADYELLDQHVTDWQKDLFDSNHIQMQTEEADLEMIEQTM